jgi:hypothetical protein
MPHLHRVESSDIDLLVLDERDRTYETASDGSMRLYTDSGVVELTWEKGTRTDGRSGGFLVDWLIPNVGDKLYRRCWFFHDCAFALASYCIRQGKLPPISFELANELFRAIGSLSRKRGGGGIAKWRMALAEDGVSTKLGRKAYDTTDKSDRKNDGKIQIRWVDR